MKYIYLFFVGSGLKYISQGITSYERITQVPVLSLMIDTVLCS